MSTQPNTNKRSKALFSENCYEGVLGLLGWGVSYVAILTIFLKQQDAVFTKSLAVSTFVYSISYLKSFAASPLRKESWIHSFLMLAFVYVFLASVFTFLNESASQWVTISVVVILSLYVFIFLFDFAFSVSSSPIKGENGQRERDIFDRNLKEKE